MESLNVEKSGKRSFYMLDDNHVKEVFEIGIEHIEHKNKKGKFFNQIYFQRKGWKENEK